MPPTDPTLPTAVDFRIAPTYLRTVNCTTAAQLNTALADAQYGDKIVLTAGSTYTATSVTGFQLKVPTGTLANGGNENYVTVISSAYDNLPAEGTRADDGDYANMPILAPASGFTIGKVLVNASGVSNPDHYRFVGLRIKSGQITNYAGPINIRPTLDTAAAAAYPSYISFERCVFDCHKDYGIAIFLTIYAKHWRVIDSSFYECKRNNGGDTQAILSCHDSGPMLIDNNTIEGMGENVFIGATNFSGRVITAGFEYIIPADITITRNLFNRRLKWLTTHATYEPCIDQEGTGTFTSSGTTVTFSSSQSGLTNCYIRNTTTDQFRKITAGSGTSWTIASAFTPDVGSAQAFRFNASGDAGTLTTKNLLEFKSGHRVLIEGNTFQNGWSAGQIFSLNMLPREGGWASDVTIRENIWDHSTGFSLSSGDYESGPGFGPAPYATSRVKVTHNLFKNLCSAAVAGQLSGVVNFALSLSLSNNRAYGGYASYGGTIAAGATTGVGVTFTNAGSSSGVFQTLDVGNVLAYGDGRATITAWTDSTHVVATITAAFPNTSANALADWYVGPAASVKLPMPVADSWVFEHNSFVGPDASYNYLPVLGNDIQDTSGIVKATNFVWQNNLMYHGDNTAGGGSGLRWTNTPAYIGGNVLAEGTTSPTWAKNVYFGTSADSFSASFYTAASVKGSTSGFTDGTIKTSFHTPDETGSSSGGSVGFTDYDGEDFTLTGTYATAATDGTMIGADIAAVEEATAGSITGVWTEGGGGGSGFAYLPIRWP